MIRLTRYGIKYFIILVLILVVFILGYQAGKSLFLSQIAEWWFSVTYKVEKAPSENVMGLDLRAYHLAADPREYDTELSSYFFYEHQEIPVDKAALVLVDVWEQKSNNDGWNERKEEIISTNIYNVLQAARATNMLVIHAPSLQVINHTVSPLENEIVLDGVRQLELPVGDN